jgi:hypothetical protein
VYFYYSNILILSMDLGFCTRPVITPMVLARVTPATARKGCVLLPRVREWISISAWTISGALAGSAAILTRPGWRTATPHRRATLKKQRHEMAADEAGSAEHRDAAGHHFLLDI